MDTISRYIFKQTVTALLMILLTLTLIVWMTTALRQIDIMTDQGQGFLIFLQITLLAIPNLITVVAPVALLISTIHMLNRLNQDSGIIIVTAAGATIWRVMRPFMLLGALVSVFVFVSNAYLSPQSLRTLRDYVVEVRTDLISQVIQPGNFISPEDGLTFHIRGREADGTLRGLMVNDARDEEQTITYLADRGRVLKQDGGSFLVMRGGHIQRVDAGRDDIQIIAFDSYVFDISELGPESKEPSYKPKERFLTELMNPDPDDKRYKSRPGKFRAELHDRIANPLYPIVFVLIAVATLGYARTTRQGTGQSVALAFATCVAVRGSGLAVTNMAVNQPWAVGLIYAIPVCAILGGLLMAQYNMRPHKARSFDLAPPAWLRELPSRWRAKRRPAHG
ncbi:MAG: LPS export ABC transporter permease LptF [Dichotomicrobium sp.]